jgi:sporulation protein YhbH
MAVKNLDWGLSGRGYKDAARHRQKIRDSIRKNIADVISDASIITQRKGQIIKVPVRGLKSYRFIFKRQSAGGLGVGQGEGKKGDVIGRRPSGDSKPGQAGDRPGIDYLETEIEVEELIDMMLQDLGLPNLQDKAVAQTEIPQGWKYDSIEKTGLISRLDKKRSIKEAIRRTAAFVGELMQRTGETEDRCRRALELAQGNLREAEKMLSEGKPLGSGGGRVALFREDLRFRTLTEDVTRHSNAVVLAMMDVSGSMGTVKKYLARSFFFWLMEFLRRIYRNVDIRFIAHTTVAKLVTEEEFFHKGESGGTFCHSAYDLAFELIEKEYQTSRWNVYPFHFSDGEDFDPPKTVASAESLLRLGVNMLGYAEIHTDPYSASTLMEGFQRHFKLERRADQSGGFELFTGFGAGIPLLGAVLRDKSHVYPTLKEFLKKERGL